MSLKSKGALAGFLARFHEILDGLDEFEADEDLEELNAQFEDALFLLECVDEDEEDAQEEIAGALEELEDILAEYRALEWERPELRQMTLELEMSIRMAGKNLG